VIGARSNVQDGAVIHADPGKPTIVGEDCVIGHRAVVHGTILEDGVLVGMGDKAELFKSAFPNGNLGTNVSVAQNVFNFSTADYSSAKITAQIRTLAGTNTQINEIVLAHDTITPYLTVYGTVASPLNSNLGVFTTAINTGVVSLKFLQNNANSNVTVVAHLIK
jgi:NDP-sugar pyrophosphorylase family protein